MSLHPSPRRFFVLPYRAAHVAAQLVPLALLKGRFSHARTPRQNFRREAAILAHLCHERIPHLYEASLGGSQWYLVLEYIDGETLKIALQRKSGRLPLHEVLAWAGRVQRSTAPKPPHKCGGTSQRGTHDYSVL